MKYKLEIMAHIMRINEFVEYDSNDYKGAKTALKIFVHYDWKSKVSVCKMEGNYEQASKLQKNLGGELNDFLIKLVEKHLKGFDYFKYEDKQKFYEENEYFFKSSSSMFDYDLNESVIPFIEDLVKGNKDETSSLAVIIDTINDDKKRKYIIYTPDKKTSEIKWNDGGDASQFGK